MADSICPVCLATFPSSDVRREHLRTGHPGYTLTWTGGVATLIDPAGTARRINRVDFRHMRARARAGTREGEGQAETPPPAEEAPGEPQDGQPAPRVGRQRPPGPDAMAAVSRATLEGALDEATLADILRTLSEAISDWDGAGPEGALSRMEAATAAHLLYDATLEQVQRRFHGDVSRFKAALAVLVILLGKGRIHARALDRRRRGIVAPPPAPAPILPEPVVAEPATEAPAASVIPVILPAPPSSSPQVGHAIAAEPGQDAGFVPMTPAELARRQSAWAQSQSPATPLPPQVRESAIDRIYGLE